jgi:hypothetical protein
VLIDVDIGHLTSRTLLRPGNAVDDLFDSYPRRLDEDTLQNKAMRLIKPLVPPDSQERVTRASKQWNSSLRGHIRGATGLKLTDREGKSGMDIPVKVVEGFSDELARLIDQHHDPVLWKLIIGQPKLGGLVEGVSFLLDVWSDLERWPKLPARLRSGDRALARSRVLAEKLQQLIVAEKIGKEISKFSTDILGIYRFRPASSIELYWMPIAMVSAMLDLKIEDLTVVVLIHELAHGYTHLGNDIDGQSWSTTGFANSDADVVEGLAQFYTAMITEEMAGKMPGPKLAYDRFLELQSGAYREHEKWLKQFTERRSEVIRFALIAARSQGHVNIRSWRSLMKAASHNLAKRRPPTLFEQTSLPEREDLGF